MGRGSKYEEESGIRKEERPREKSREMPETSLPGSLQLAIHGGGRKVGQKKGKNPRGKM